MPGAHEKKEMDLDLAESAVNGIKDNIGSLRYAAPENQHLFIAMACENLQLLTDALNITKEK